MAFTQEIFEVYRPGTDKPVFEPTESMQAVLDLITANDLGFYAPEVAAGVLANFMSGSDLERFVDALVDDGLTRYGLLALAGAAIDKVGEMDK